MLLLLLLLTMVVKDQAQIRISKRKSANHHVI